MNEPLKAIVLAAGKGTRLRTEGVDLPKVLRLAAGRPLLSYVLEALDFLPPEDIVLVVGYELDLDKSLLRPVAVTVACRLAVMGGLLALVSFILFRIVPYDEGLQIALMILYALPAPFIIPLFADVGEEGKYISTALSVHTICTIALFAAIAAFSLR